MQRFFSIIRKALKACYLWVFLISSSLAFAQNSHVKAIRLVTGDIVPAIVKPAESKAAPGGIFDGKYFKLIQFVQIPSDLERQQWAHAGLRLVDYLPEDTYFAVIDQSFDLHRLDGRATTIIDAADVFRLEPALAELCARGGSTNRLVVSYYASLDEQKIISVIKSRGVDIEAYRNYSRQLDIIFDPALMDEIIALPFLQFLGLPPEEPALEGYDHRNSTGRSNYLNTGYSGLSYNGAGVVIAIGESGTVDNLADAKGRLTEMETGSPSSHKIGVMQNAGGAGNLDPSNRNNAWGATLLSAPTSPNYSSLYTSHTLRYTNHSYGDGTTPSGGYDQRARDHDLRIASLPNHLVIYSAGNSGDQVGYAPYAFATWATITGPMKENKNQLAIGALTPADVLTSFSSRGPMYDGRIIPQVVIEGIEGTSDAAPKVTGNLAILSQVYKAKNAGVEPPSSLLRAVLMNTADDLGNPGPDFKHGYGRPNMRRAYSIIDNAQHLTSSVSNGGTNSHMITVPVNTKQVRVLIVWPDVAAAVNANPAIVNNLHLVAKDPSSTSYNPWVLDHTANPTNLDLPATRSVDNLNTIEQVTVDNPASGSWTIEVSGASVPSGPQSYFLTYEFLLDELHMGFPLQDHRFVPGNTYHLKWDSYGGSGTFSLDYRLDGGSWVSIASGYDATSRTYQWTVPSVSGIHQIEFRVQRGALTAASGVNYIGDVPKNFTLLWACDDGVGLDWDPVAGADGYRVYRLGAQTMEQVTTNITFDGTSAILTGQNAADKEYYAVSAVTGSYEGVRTIAATKAVGDYNCYNAKTTAAGSVDETDITLKGLVNPHSTTLTNVRFEYGPTTSYGSYSSNIAITATGHTEEAVSSTIASTLSDRADVLHFRLTAIKGGSPVYGDDQEIRLTPGYDFTFDGVDDYIDVSGHSALPVYRRGTGTAYSIAMWVKGAASSGKKLYSETSSSGVARFALMTYTDGKLWVYIKDDNDVVRRNNLHNGILFDNTWHHLALVDANGSLKTYIDGNLAHSVTYTPGPMSLDRAAFGVLLNPSIADYYAGRIDQVSFWDKALSATEIGTLIHQPLQDTEANLKAHYHLDDASNCVFDAVSSKEAVIVGGSSKTFSIVPMGVLGKLVQTLTPTSIGDAGKHLLVTITSSSPTTNYLGIYRTGTGAARISGETLPSGVNQRASILWGIREYGAVTANLVFDYSTIAGITDPSKIRLLKRTDAAGTWADVTADYTHNETARTFSKTGVTDFSEFSLGDQSEPIAVELASFVAHFVDGKIALTWAAASVVEKFGYVVERSADNFTFIKIGEVPFLNTEQERAEYSFTDADITIGRQYHYRLAEIDLNGISTYYPAISVDTANTLPTKFALYPNFPNPFNPGTTIRFDLPANQGGKHWVQITIYNMLGQKARTLLDRDFAAGAYSEYWDGGNDTGRLLSSGVYFLVIKSGEFSATQKMFMLR